ncbi:PI-PLC X domain-containing protein 1 isoform X3 [Arvicanthis niloticus]|uniref:PI-PLC X domain-containing protein 1 isoform X2 n=1 Tax=Arvicanthis niloticus TaxID=61156 RepID=UPI00402B887F
MRDITAATPLWGTESFGGGSSGHRLASGTAWTSVLPLLHLAWTPARSGDSSPHGRPGRLDVAAVSAAVGCPAAPAVHPREPRHDDILPDPQVSDLPCMLSATAPAEPGRAFHHWAGGDEMTLDVTQQLDAGVRYLDLRIAHAPGGSARNLCFVHMMYTKALVEDTLTEIAEWLQSHPREVVILACRNFEGMTRELHDYLVGCMVNIFGDTLCPSGEIPTLGQLWARGQQVIVSYEDEATVSRYDKLWPAIPYWWGNAVKPDVLLRFLETMKGQGRPGGLFVAGINITENLCYILLHPVDSLEEMTRRSLPLMTKWVCAQQPGQSPQCTNIIAGDFVGADGFVSEVISLNRKLLSP